MHGGMNLPGVPSTSTSPQAPAGGGGGGPPVPASAPLPQPGELLKQRYRVGDVHRVGGMGVVFRGVDEHTGGEIALKTVRQGCSKAVLARFVLEAELPVPEHPCLARTVDRFVEGGRPYQVQDFVPGRSLQEILQAREDGMTPESPAESPWFDPGLQLRTAVYTVAQVARGLEALHQAGVLHRDLKPANLVWHEDGRAVVVDFGLAVCEEGSMAHTQTGQAVGTAGFMAPEQRRGGKADARTEVYALGATLWALLPGNSLLAADEPPLPSDLPPSLSEALQTALEWNPVHRFPSVTAFADALSDWLEDPGSAGGRVSKRTAGRRWLLRNRFRVALTSAVALFLLAVFLAWALWMQSAASASSAAAIWQAQVGRAREAGERIGNLFDRVDEPEGAAVERDLKELFAMIAVDPAMSHSQTRESRRAALQLLLFTGGAEEARKRSTEWPLLDPDWAEFENYRLQASVAAANSDWEGAIRFLAEGAAVWPVNADLAAAASRVLERLSQPLVLPWTFFGIFQERLGDTAALVNENGGAVAIRFDDGGGEHRLPICPPGSFSGGRVVGGCRVRRDGVILGSLLYFQVDERPEQEASAGGIYWQPVDLAVRPRLVLPRPSTPRLWVGGMVPSDLLGDGQDEVILPLVHTAGGAAILRLEESGWRSYELPIRGNDVHSVQVVPAQDGAPACFWLGTSTWNVGNQGYRLHRFSAEARDGGLLLRRPFRLPLGAVSTAGALRGWDAPVFASFSFLDDSVFFGGEHRTARSAELWSLKQHDDHGLCPERKLWGTPRVSRFGREDIESAAADLDADGRDEIYSCWKWRQENLGACFSVTDGQGEILTLALPWAGGGVRVLRDPATSADTLLVEYVDKRGDKQFLAFPGRVEVPLSSTPPCPDPGLQQVVLVRSGGAGLEGSFRIPETWTPGDGGDWLSAGFRISHADFNSGASLLIERMDWPGEPESSVRLELSTQGGGGVYHHILASKEDQEDGTSRQMESELALLPGGWVDILLRPDAEATGMEIDARQEDGTPGGGRSETFPVPVRPLAGAEYRWSWVPSSDKTGIEPRDRFAVLALEWSGPGRRPPGGIDRGGAVAELAEVERHYRKLVAAAERGDLDAFESARSALDALAPDSREGTRSDRQRNGLAAYRLESAPVWLMGGVEVEEQ